ncbi:MAG: hypothetical protein ACI9S8_002210 [Chlamydiales bacterium]|jgi:hypothetical protein
MSLTTVQTQAFSRNSPLLLEPAPTSTGATASEKTSLFASKYFDDLEDDILNEWTLLPSNEESIKGINDYIWIDIGNLADCLWISLNLSEIIQVQEHCAIEFTWVETHHGSKPPFLQEEHPQSISENLDTIFPCPITPNLCTRAETMSEFVNAFTSENKWMIFDHFPSKVFNATEIAFKKTRPIPGFENIQLPDQLFLDITRQAIYVNGSVIPKKGIEDIQVAVLWEQLLRCTKNPDQAKAVAKLCTQATVFDMTEMIWKRYTNSYLDIFPTQSSTRIGSKNPNLTFSIYTHNGNTRIKVTMWYQLIKIDSNAETLGHIKGTTLIDLDENQAIIVWSDLLPNRYEEK